MEGAWYALICRPLLILGGFVLDGLGLDDEGFVPAYDRHRRLGTSFRADRPPGW
jgi:hypothetical protein